MCRAEFSLPSITAEEGAQEKKAPIRVKFEIPYFTVSGIQVIHLMFVVCVSNILSVVFSRSLQSVNGSLSCVLCRFGI